jgi:hypothetical protein
VSVIPIDEAAYTEAFNAAFPGSAEDPAISDRRLRRGISAYLSAIGLTQERDIAGMDDRVPRPDRVREVTPWRPLTTTDGVCKERSAAGSECYHHDGHDTPHSWEEVTTTERFESEDAMRFGPRSYTPDQQAVIDQAVAERKPLTAPCLTTTEEETDG